MMAHNKRIRGLLHLELHRDKHDARRILCEQPTPSRSKSRALIRLPKASSSKRIHFVLCVHMNALARPHPAPAHPAPIRPDPPRPTPPKRISRGILRTIVLLSLSPATLLHYKSEDPSTSGRSASTPTIKNKTGTRMCNCKHIHIYTRYIYFVCDKSLSARQQRTNPPPSL